MASTIETFQFAIKDRYDEVSRVEDLTMADRPLMAMLTKSTDLSGDNTIIPMIFGRPQGVAAIGVGTAQTSATNVEGAKLLLTAGDLGGSVFIGDKVIAASRNNPGAFLKNKTAEIDGLYEQMADDIAVMIYGNSGNSVGVIASGGVSVGTGKDGGDLITLTEATQALNFEVGMSLDTSSNDGSTSGTVAVAAKVVVAVDRASGIIDVGDGTSGFTAGHYLFRTGNYGGTSAVFTFHGLGSFLWPDNSPPNIYGMDRTPDPIRLAGCRVDAADIAGLNIEEKLQTLGSYMMGRFKGKGATHAFLNPEDFTRLSIALQSRATVPIKDTSTRFGFEAITVNLGGKSVKIYSDPWCPVGNFFALRLKDWTLHSMEELIKPIKADGLTLLRGATNNDYEYRLISYPSMSCKAPGYSGRVAV